jgi:hypothetical protein
MDYSAKLVPIGTEEIKLPSGRLVAVLKAAPTFEPWTGTPMNYSFGRKPAVALAGGPIFAEIAILRLLKTAGWSGRWVSTYATSRARPRLLTSWNDDVPLKCQVSEPIAETMPSELLTRIVKANGEHFAGCWDVFAWKGDVAIFAEAKRHLRDRVRKTQRRWLEAALDVGLSENSFLLVEWQSGSEAPVA